MAQIPEISLRECIRLNLISAMSKAGVNQVQFAEKLGISKGTVNNWVRGNNSPDVDMVPKICKVLGISVLDLYSSAKFEPRETKPETQKASLYSSEALGLARDYDDKMDTWGRKQVRAVADNEIARCAAELGMQQEHRLRVSPPPAGDGMCYIIPEYFGRVSAGSGQPAADERPENAHLTRQPPRGASYITHISGDSMEPTYHDGDRVFVSAIINIFPGEIGVFLQGGEQYIKELGDGVLISHNTKYPPIPLQDDIRCQGVVLGVCDDSYFEST